MPLHDLFDVPHKGAPHDEGAGAEQTASNESWLKTRRGHVRRETARQGCSDWGADVAMGFYAGEDVFLRPLLGLPHARVWSV